MMWFIAIAVVSFVLSGWIRAKQEEQYQSYEDNHERMRRLMEWE